ncbi:MAG: YciI family protein [Robiginitomaculum sp.]
MHFVIFAKDKAGALDVRMANRDAHIAFLKAGGNVTVKVAGPMLSDDGETMIGSMLIVEAASLLAVKAWAKADPYAKAGLSQSVEILPYNWAIGS